ncbi:MAG: hypothetical protein WCJ37_08650 [Syntrophus sp. (in: bacteria)]
MSKINSEILLKMVEEKASRKEMSERFKCSEAAVSKKLTRLTAPAEPAEPLKIDVLTPKEKSFVIAMARGESQTSAACHAYDVGSRQSGKSLGHTLMKIGGIQEALAEIRDREIPIAHLVKRLRTHVDSQDPATSLRATDMGLKLWDAYPAAKNLNTNVNVDCSPVDLSKYSNYGRKRFDHL